MPKQPKEKEPIQIEAPMPTEADKRVPHLVYASLEFEVQAIDEVDAEVKGREILDDIIKKNKDYFMRVQSAKIADKLTGYVFRK